MIWAVVPAKDLRAVKQRLSGLLEADERRALFLAMFEDVLTTVRSADGLGGVLVVTRDPDLSCFAERLGARLLREPDNRGHTEAVARGAAALAAEGVSGILTIPGDVPLVTRNEIHRVLGVHGPAPAVTIVPSRDERGSNCIVCSPPDALPFGFGDDSFLPHLAAARARGIGPCVAWAPGIGLDIDTPDDLAELIARPGCTRAQAFLAQSGIADRLVSRARRRLP